jgi:hypothetical protein
MSDRRSGFLVYGLLLVAAFCFRAVIARLLPNDSPNDGKIYSQLARNMLEQHVYSHAPEPPYDPSLIRLPGYPLFLAGIYALFGHHDDTAVRVMQALIDTASCALIALVAFNWEPDGKRKRAAAIAALALAAVCPFTAIYVGTILTETPTMLLAVAMCLTATLAYKAPTSRRSIALWAITGLIAGIAVLFRPDSGLFAAAIGFTILLSTLFHPKRAVERNSPNETWQRFSRSAYCGAVFSLAFVLVLVPWTIRNRRVFHLFQPLAPAHAEMPGEFVPRGYLSWLRTWLDDERYIGPVLWSLDELPIKLADIPDRAFDSIQEKLRVATLLEKYNHPQQEEGLLETAESSLQSLPTAPEAQAQNPHPSPEPEIGPSEEAEQGDEGTDGDAGDETDEAEESVDSESADQDTQAQAQEPVEMTPEIDAGFAAIAQQRIARAPLRYYLGLPAKRAVSLWCNTHSQYYPFEGELLPLEDLDYDIYQQLWLPLFAGLTGIYTLLGLAGGWLLWRSGGFPARRWLFLALLIIFLRLGFFSTLENPEPRYVVEIFPFLSILGGIAIPQITSFTKVVRRVSGSH